MDTTNARPYQSDRSDLSWTHDVNMDEVRKAILRAMGEELRACREARGWSQRTFAKLLPSGINASTVPIYDRGQREMFLTRWVELCMVLGVSPGVLLDRALQAARVALQVVVLRVDLHQLIVSDNARVNRWRRGPTTDWTPPSTE